MDDIFIWKNIKFSGLYNGYDYDKEFVAEKIKKWKAKEKRKDISV